MALQIQYDFFKTPEEIEIELIRKTVLEFKESNDKVRKGLFARHNELAKMYVDMKNRLEIIERGICSTK